MTGKLCSEWKFEMWILEALMWTKFVLQTLQADLNRLLVVPLPKAQCHEHAGFGAPVCDSIM